MKVELTPQKRYSVMNGRELPPIQYEIFVDGLHVGFLPFKTLQPLLFVTIGPMETAGLMRQIRDLVTESTIGEAVHPPKPMKPKEDDVDYFDPFAAFESYETENEADNG